MNQIEGIIFDMDGTMLDTERLGREAWEAAIEEMQLTVDEDFYLKLIGRSSKATQEFFRTEMAEDFPGEALKAAADRHYKRLYSEKPIPKKPGVDELIDYLYNFSIPRAIATSTVTKLTWHKLMSTGLFARFDEIICGDMVENSKPNPDIYLLAAKKIGVKPENCLALEDSPLGVRAAKDAGCTVFMIPDLIQPDVSTLEYADEIFDDLHAVREFLQANRSLLEPEPATCEA